MLWINFTVAVNDPKGKVIAQPGKRGSSFILVHTVGPSSLVLSTLTGNTSLEFQTRLCLEVEGTGPGIILSGSLSMPGLLFPYGLPLKC